MPVEDKSDAEDAVSLMQDTGRFLDSILAFQQEKAAAGLLMSEEALNESITFCRNFVQDPQNIYLIGLFNGKVDALQDASEEEKTQLKQDYQKAVVEVLAPAYGRLADGLETLKPQCAGKGLGQTEEGKAYYAALIKQKTGSDRSADDMIAMLDEALKENDRDWTRMMDRDGGLQRKVQNSTLATKDPNVILNTLQTQILSDFPAVETETYSIEHTNEQIKDNGTGGIYYTSSNTIYLSDAEAQSQSNLYLTLAHEGFPGHLYQKSYAKNLPHALFRGNAVFEGYEEGWATYVELYSAKYAQDTDLKRDFLANEAIGSDLISARIDLGVNHQGWGKKEIKSLLRKYQYDTDAETVNYYWNEAVSSPGESLAYAIGYLEIMELKTYAQTELGDAYTDLAFHQAVLDAGPSPFWHVRDCVEAYVSKNKPQPEAQEQPAADTSFLAVAA